jgi:starvation-inducible DNA-binding protein
MRSWLQQPAEWAAIQKGDQFMFRNQMTHSGFPGEELAMGKALNSDMAAMHLAVVPSVLGIVLPAAPNPIADRDDQYSTGIHIDAAVRSQLRKLLDQHLADTLDLLSQTKQAHWNATGMYFHQFHKLFDRLAKDLDDHANFIAKRITALGGVAKATVRTAAADSRLPELPLDLGDGKCTVGLLEARYAQLAQTTREAIDEVLRLGDADTSNLLTRTSLDLDQARWFLEAHLRA